MALSFECWDCKFFTRRDDLIEEHTEVGRFGRQVPHYVGECGLYNKIVVCWNNLQEPGCESWQPENEEDESEYGNWVECQ